MKYSSNEIRKKYLEYFESKWHKIIHSASLIPENDPTTLFTWSWMQPMLQYLLWEKHPLWTRITDSQKAFRAADIEDIWDNRHTTFFEMLWNWSLWDYFKKEQINWIFDFFVNELWLDTKKIYISVYRWNKDLKIPRDDESVKIWQELFKTKWIDAKAVDLAEINWMQWGKIFYYDEKENWWSRSWTPENMPVWEPGGPDSEMFWDFGENLWLHEKSKYKNKPCHPACDCGRFLEFANNVFMQYKKTESWFEELEKKNIDFGWGLERIAVALNDTPDIFLWDLFSWIRNKIEELSWKKYWENEKETEAFRIVMDHLRVVTFLIWDWAVPSNKDQWYFTRRMLRRAIRFSKVLWVSQSISKEVAKVVIDEYKSHYKELEQNRDFILEEIDKEEKQFLQTLEKGLKEFEKLTKGFEIALEKTWNKIDIISWVKAFKLYDTYGFPVEMTIELAEENWLKVDLEWFKKAEKEHQDKSRTASSWKFKWGLADSSEETTSLHSATHLLLSGLNEVLWWGIAQKGSNITSERLRFDFNFDRKIEKPELDKIEDFVNQAINSWLQVTIENMDKQLAKDSWVQWSFWEKYPDTVKVYSMTWENWIVYSRELCGWPHVKDSKNMGRFKIKKEESSSRGVRRIKAVLVKD